MDIYEKDLQISIHKNNHMQKHGTNPIFGNFFLIPKCEPYDMEYSLYYEYDYQNLHHFSDTHPFQNLAIFQNSKRLIKNESRRKTIQKITNDCETCIKYGTVPRRFKLTIYRCDEG